MISETLWICIWWGIPSLIAIVLFLVMYLNKRIDRNQARVAEAMAEMRGVERRLYTAIHDQENELTTLTNKQRMTVAEQATQFKEQDKKREYVLKLLKERIDVHTAVPIGSREGYDSQPVTVVVGGLLRELGLKFETVQPGVKFSKILKKLD